MNNRNKLFNDDAYMPSHRGQMDILRPQVFAAESNYGFPRHSINSFKMISSTSNHKIKSVVLLRGWGMDMMIGVFLLLGVLGAKGQTNISNYSFTTTTGSTYTPITGGTVFVSSTYDDDISAEITMGGSFPFGGVPQTTCFISSNGFIVFGAAPSNNNYNPLSTLESTTGAISAFGQDAYASSVMGSAPEIRYQDLGTEFVVQYQDHANYYNNTSERLNFQIRLTYSTGEINIVYGDCTSPGIVSTSGQPVQVGIRGNSIDYATNVSNLYAANVPASTTCDWSHAVAGFDNTSGLLFSGTINSNVKMISGLKYTWAPLSTQAPVRTFAAPTSISSSGATVSWTDPSGATQYNVQYRIPGACTWTNWSGNPVSTNSVSLTGLTANTSYQVRVQASNGSENSIYSHIPGSSGSTDGYTTAGTFTTLLPSCVTPTSLSASMSLTPGVSTVVGSFSAAVSSLPTGYVVVRTTTNVQPNPVTGTSYSVGTNAIGYIEYVNTVSGGWTSTGLNSSTNYYYWVFSYNNTACFGGPLFSASSTSLSTTTSPCTITGTKTIGASGADYSSLALALADIKIKGLSGNTVLELQTNFTTPEDLATGKLDFSGIPCLGSAATLTIMPASGVASILTITSANTTATVDLNGASYVTFDGRNDVLGANKYLSIANTSTATGGAAFRFINEASNNTVKYTNLSALYPSTSSGVVNFLSTTGANGNDNNTIDNCNIDGGAGATASPTLVALNGIYASGTTTTAETNNSGNTISSCNIFNNFGATGVTSAGISLQGGNTDWTISGNSIYQTAPRTALTTAVTVYGITIANTSGNNFLISNNFIGGSAATNAGSAWTVTGALANRFNGIGLSVGNTTASSVQGNTISNFAFTSTSNATLNSTSAPLGTGIWGGIMIAAGSANVGTTTANTIGGATGTGSITVTGGTTGGTVNGIGVSGSGTVVISNNNIGSITTNSSAATISTGIIGIQSASTRTVTINSNTIGSASTANSLNASWASTGTTGQLIMGIYNSGAATSMSITNNTIANISNAYLPNAAYTTNTVIRGIFSNAGVNTITGNTIRNFTLAANATGTTAAASIIGISLTSATTGTILSQNTVHSLSNTHATAATQVTGIYYSGATTGTNVVARNFVHSLSVSSSSATARLNGIYIGGGVANYQNNMIRLGIDATGASLTNGIIIAGIDKQTTQNNNIYFNSIYIGGASVVTTAANTFAFRKGSTGTDVLQNNIFVNARSNSTSTGKHYAVGLNAMTTLTINNNDYFVNGTGGIVGYIGTPGTTDYSTLALFRTATAQDGNSINVNPPFITPTGTSATVDLHVTAASNSGIESGAVAIAGINNDFDGHVRPGGGGTTNGGGISADIGADEGDFALVQTRYYSKSTGDLRTLATWGQNTNGTGTPPTNFTTAGQIFVIKNNAAPTIGAAWVVSGAQSYISLGDGTNPVNFTIPASFSLTGTINLSANSTLTIQNTTLPSFGSINVNSTVDFASAGAQTIPAISFGNLTSSSTGARTLAAAGTIYVAGTFTPGSNAYTTTSSTMNFNGISAQTIPTFTFNNLIAANAAGCTTDSSPTVNTTFTASENFTISASGTVTLGSAANCVISASKTLTVAVSGTLQNNSVTAFTLNGSLLVNGNYVHNANASTIPATNTTYSAGSNLKVGNGGTNIAGTPVALPLTIGGNVIWNCPSQNAGFLFLGGTATIGGDFTIVSTGSGYITNGIDATARTLRIGGTLDLSGGNYYISGIGAGTVTQSTSAANLSVSSGELILNSGSSLGSGALTLNAGGNFTMTGGAVFINNSSASSGIATLTVPGNFDMTLGTFTISNSGGTGAGTFSVDGNATITGGTFNMTSASGTSEASFNLKGNLAQSAGTITRSGNSVATLSCIGSNAQSLSTTGLGGTGNYNLSINNTAGVGLGSNLSIVGTITLTNGLFMLNNYDLTLGATTTVSGTASSTKMMVTNGSGQLKKIFNGISSFTFPIGETTGTTEYSPVTLNFSANSSADRTIGIKVTDADPPSVGSASHFLSRYWSFTDDQAGSYTYTPTFTYLTADITGAESSIAPSIFNGASWNQVGGSAASHSLIVTPALTETTGLIGGNVFTGRATPPVLFTWTGAVSNDWTNPANWSSSGVPSSGENVTIATTVNNPSLTGNITLGSIVFNPGVPPSISLGANTLSVNGSISGTGTLIGSSQSSLVIGGAAGTINFDQTSAEARTLKNLTLNASASATLGTALELTAGVTPGTLIVNSGATLSTGGLLTLKSDNNGTARVGISSGTVAGNVTVERHIPNNGFRSWRLLSVPTYGNQTINGSWQEGNIPMGNNTPGFGTQITGSSTALGFDDLSSYPSMLLFNGTNFAGIPNTGIPISNNKAYFMYVRGDRTAGVSVSTNANSATTLRTTGSIYQGTQITSNIPANSYSLIGNPFASTIDFTGITRTGGVKDAFYIWDSKINSGTSLGVYQTFSGTNAYLSPLPNGSFNQGQPNTSIQSGQAFFVENGPSTGSVTIPESCKVASSASTGFKLPGELVKIDSRLYSLTAADTTMADANVLVFDTAYSNAVDVEDASKFSNTGENLGILRHSETLVIEGRKPVITSDTLFFKMWNMKAHAYQLEFVPQNLGAQNLTARLEDGYLHTSTVLNLSVISRVNFVVNTSPASYASNRFRLVFGPSVLVPVRFQSIGAYRKAANAQVNWKVGNETNIDRYEVERSTDGSKFEVVGSVIANATFAYGFTDLNVPSSNLFYRIRSIGIAGDVTYSSVVKVSMESSKPSFAVVPNPVEGELMNIQFENQAKGLFQLRLVNALGQQVTSVMASHPGGFGTHTISLPYGLARGMYQLEIVAPDKTTNTLKAVVISK